MKSPNRYQQIIESVFFAHFHPGDVEVSFEREALVTAAAQLAIELPKNLGDIVYSVRYRYSLPDSVRELAPDGLEWVIEGTGNGSYKFKAVELAHIHPSEHLAETKIPDSTPSVIDLYRQNDEQALLAKLRYNRLVDIFLGITCYSLQNHLRTSVRGIGQVETDEIYVGVDTRGAHYVIPVQAKGGNDKSSSVQIAQDFALCEEKFPDLICRPLGAQFMDDDLIALFSFDLQSGRPVVLSEKHYRLVNSSDLSADEVRMYRTRPLV